MVQKKRKRKRKKTRVGYVGNLICDYVYLYREIFGEGEDSKDSPFWLIRGQKYNKFILPNGVMRSFIVTMYKLLRYGDMAISNRDNPDKRNFMGGEPVISVRRDIEEVVFSARITKFRRQEKHLYVFEYIRRKYPKVQITKHLIGLLSDILDEPFYILHSARRSIVWSRNREGGAADRMRKIPDEELEKEIGEEWKKKIDLLLSDRKHPKVVSLM